MEISKAADDALIVLIAVADGAQTETELVQSTELDSTVVRRMLATLGARDFLCEPYPGTYTLGSAVVLASHTSESMLGRMAREEMRRLAETAGETVVLSIPDGDETVTIEQVVGTRHALRVERSLGDRRSLMDSAGQRAVLAFLPDAVIDRLLARETDAARWRRELALIRTAGYATSRDDERDGVVAIAAPVRIGLRVAASMALLAPESRGSALHDQVEVLLASAARLSSALSVAHEAATPSGFRSDDQSK